jgi:vitamin B12 transporter
MMKNLLILGALLAPALLAAQTPATPLPAVVVTATGTEQAADRVLAPVVVIDRETIARSQAVDLAELLRFQAGLEIGRNGGPGSVTSVFIRGANSNHSLVLIDGVRINALPTGTAALQNIAPEMIERIEILKGPRATLYGSEALGGVINVITRRAEGSTAHALLRGGSDRLVDGQVGGGLRTGPVDLFADFGHLDTEGDIFRAGAEVPRGTRRSTANLRGGVTLGDLRLEARAWNADGVSEYYGGFMPPPTPISQNFHNQTLALGGRLQSGIGATTLNLSRMRDVVEQNESADYAQSRRDQIDLSQQIDLGAHALIGRLEYASETGDSFGFGTAARERRDLQQATLQGLFDFGAFSTVAAASFIDHEAFGSHGNGNLELGYRFGNGLQLLAGVGSGFRAPTVAERFGFGANPELEAERSLTAETGLRWNTSERQQIEARYFFNRTRNLINFQCDENFNCLAVNIDRSRNQGLDLRYVLLWDSLRLSVGGLLQDPENAETGERLLRRARTQLTASVEQTFSRYRWGLDVLGSGDRLDFGNQPLPGYALVNLTAGVDLLPALRLEGRVENLLDTTYETARGFRTPDRAGTLGLRYQWQR